MSSLLDKTRSLNRLLQKAAGYPVNFNEMSEVLKKVLDSNVYVVSKRGKILGFNTTEDFECEAIDKLLEEDATFPEEFNDRLLHVIETSPNVQDKGTCAFITGEDCIFDKQYVTIVPVNGGGERLGTLLLVRFTKPFGDEDLVLAEYGATVVGMEILRSKSDKIEEEARKKAAVQIALGTLSFSELEAIEHIFDELKGDEGMLVASKIADRVGITRSVIVNALRKFESAGVIESRSLGMKGTYIRVLNDRLLEELDKLKKR